jgi:hypothetical protein
LAGFHGDFRSVSVSGLAVFVPRLRGYRVKAQCIYCIGSRRLDYECTWFLYVQVLRGEVESGDDAIEATALDRTGSASEPDVSDW